MGKIRWIRVCVLLVMTVTVMTACGRKNGNNMTTAPDTGSAGAGTTMGVISFGDGETAFVSTSGDYEKYFEQDGRRYHHILDPRTGYPAWNGTIAATVVCDNGLTSDAC